MLLAIISDIHDNTANLKKVLDYCRENKIEKIICCGDLATMGTLDFLNDNFSGEIFHTFGNMDTEYLSDANPPPTYKHTHVNRHTGEIEIENYKIAFVHYPDVAKELCESGNYDFVFYGHTHKPWTEVINNCTLLNPGNVANQYYLPTFAIWNTRNNSFELIRINGLA